MTRMLSPPKRVRGEGHQAAQRADQVVRPLRRKERAVPAIMLNDKDTNEKTGRQRRYRQRDPDRAKIHRAASSEESSEGCQKLPEATLQSRCLKARGP